MNKHYLNIQSNYQNKMLKDKENEILKNEIRKENVDKKKLGEYKDIINRNFVPKKSEIDPKNLTDFFIEQEGEEITEIEYEEMIGKIGNSNFYDKILKNLMEINLGLLNFLYDLWSEEEVDLNGITIHPSLKKFFFNEFSSRDVIEILSSDEIYENFLVIFKQEEYNPRWVYVGHIHYQLNPLVLIKFLVKDKLQAGKMKSKEMVKYLVDIIGTVTNKMTECKNGMNSIQYFFQFKKNNNMKYFGLKISELINIEFLKIENDYLKVFKIQSCLKEFPKFPKEINFYLEGNFVKMVGIEMDLNKKSQKSHSNNSSLSKKSPSNNSSQINSSRTKKLIANEGINYY